MTQHPLASHTEARTSARVQVARSITQASNYNATVHCHPPSKFEIQLSEKTSRRCLLSVSESMCGWEMAWASSPPAGASGCVTLCLVPASKALPGVRARFEVSLALTALRKLPPISITRAALRGNHNRNQGSQSKKITQKAFGGELFCVIWGSDVRGQKSSPA